METRHVTRPGGLPPVPRSADDPPRAEAPAAAPHDRAQQFVSRLRAAAPGFAAAATARSAVVPEVVPPARHRRARCRVVLRDADGTDSDLTFLGPAGEPDAPTLDFDRQIRRWLAAGRPREAAWMVADPRAADGEAVDIRAWLGGSTAS